MNCQMKYILKNKVDEKQNNKGNIVKQKKFR